MKRGTFITLLLLAIQAGGLIGLWLMNPKPGSMVQSLTGGSPSAPQEALIWPPVIGKPYPDLALYDSNGKPFHLSRFKG